MTVKAYISDFSKKILREQEETEVIKQDIKKVVQSVLDGLKGTENDSQILSQINKALLDYTNTNPEVSLDLAKKVFSDLALSNVWDELRVETDDEEEELLEEQDEYPEWLVHDLHKVIKQAFGDVDLDSTVQVAEAMSKVFSRAKGMNDILEEPYNEAEFMEFVKSQIAEILSPESTKPITEFRSKSRMKKRLKKKNESTYEATSAGSDKLPQSIKQEIESEIIGIIEGLKDEGIEVIYSKIAEWLNEFLRENDYSRAPVVELIDGLLDEYGLNSEYETNGVEEPKENGTNESAIYRVYHKSASYFAE